MTLASFHSEEHLQTLPLRQQGQLAVAKVSGATCAALVGHLLFYSFVTTLLRTIFMVDPKFLLTLAWGQSVLHLTRLFSDFGIAGTFALVGILTTTRRKVTAFAP